MKVAASASTQEEVVYDNDDYYYYEDDEIEDYQVYKQKQKQRLRNERLRRLQERRRAWLAQKREEYYKSLSQWRRPKRVRRPRPARPTNSNRRHHENKGESTSFFRSMLGVDPFCVHDDAQFSCTFTPFCWMQGGVAMGGCDSMLYSCCVSHTIARRQVRIKLQFFKNNQSEQSLSFQNKLGQSQQNLSFLLSSLKTYPNPFCWMQGGVTIALNMLFLA